MKRFVYISILALSCLWSNSFAQDMHFSQYFSSPLNLNPALTGLSKGNLRGNLNYRNQWFALSSYATYAVSVDANIIRDRLDDDMLGVGVSFFQDVEEKSKYKNTQIALSAAYNLKITNRPLQYIGFGLQPTLLRKQIDLMSAVYGTLYETGVNTDPLGFNEYGGFKFDLNMGISYYGYFSRKHLVATGFTMSHINKPNFSISGTDELYRKYSAYLLADMKVGTRGLAWLRPTFYFNKQGPSVEFIPGLNTKIQFWNALNDIYLGFGVYARFVGHEANNLSGTDLISVVQFEVENMILGFSYDVVLSNLQVATGRNGGPELSLTFNLDFSNSRYRKNENFKVPNF